MMRNVDEIVDFGVTYPDAADLQLRIVHYKLSDDRAFDPPSDSVLLWNDTRTANSHSLSILWGQSEAKRRR